MARIWHVLGGSTLGGGTYVVRRLAEALLRQGHAVTIVSSHRETGDLFARLGCEVVRDLELRREIAPWSDLRGTLRLAALLRGRGCDLLHTHTSKGGVVGRVAGRLAGVRRIVHHVHGFAFDPVFSPPRKLAFYTGIERIAALLCDALVFVNAADLELARKLRIVRPGQEARVAHNGVETPAELLAAERRAGERVRVLFFGRLAEQKGVDVLLDAAARLRPSGGWELLIAGDGPERERLQARAAALPAGACRFLGHRSDVAELLAAADVVALPSRWEGHSIAVLEAMAHAKAVLTTTIKGNVETIVSGADGILAPPGDATAFAAALQVLIDNPALRRRLGEAARRKVRSRFRAADMVQGVLDLYETLGVCGVPRGAPCAP